jgi:hypothetical protein
VIQTIVGRLKLSRCSLLEFDDSACLDKSMNGCNHVESRGAAHIMNAQLTVFHSLWAGIATSLIWEQERR